MFMVVDDLKKIDIATDNEADKLAATIKNALDKKHLLVIIGRCSVDYEGRGKSRLESGDRIVIVKQDGSVLVHRPVGFAPVNWQPGSTRITIRVTGGRGLELVSVRASPREILRVVFENVYIVIVGFGLSDAGEFTMYVDEEELKNIIEKEPSLVEEGLRIVEREYRIGDFYVDFYAKDKMNNDVLIEVKDEKAGVESVVQLYKYLLEAQKRNMKVRGILVSVGFSREATMLAEKLGIKRVEINPKEIYAKYIGEKRTGEESLERFFSGKNNN